MSGLDRRLKWDLRFLELARLVSSWSKDPSTKVGAVIVDQDLRVMSLGFNGLPINVADMPDRYQDRNAKYSMIVHGDMNALIFARRDIRGCTMYTHPFLPCDRCAGPVIQSGIVRVVSTLPSEEVTSRWGGSVDRSRAMFIEAGIEFQEIPIAY